MGAFKDHHISNLKKLDAEQIIKLHPKQDDMHDVRDNLMSFIIAAAYHQLLDKKNKHEQRWGPKDTTDPDAYNFSEFNISGLTEIADELIDELADLMRQSAHRDMHMYLKMMDVPEPLDDHK